MSVDIQTNTTQYITMSQDKYPGYKFLPHLILDNDGTILRNGGRSPYGGDAIMSWDKKFDANKMIGVCDDSTYKYNVPPNKCAGFSTDGDLIQWNTPQYDSTYKYSENGGTYYKVRNGQSMIGNSCDILKGTLDANGNCNFPLKDAKKNIFIRNNYAAKLLADQSPSSETVGIPLGTYTGKQNYVFYRGLDNTEVDVKKTSKICSGVNNNVACYKKACDSLGDKCTGFSTNGNLKYSFLPIDVTKKKWNTQNDGFYFKG